MDLALLGIGVDSRPVAIASGELDRFTRMGARAEKSAKGLTVAGKGMGMGMRLAAKGLVAVTAGLAAFASAGRAITQARDFGAAMAETSTLIEGTAAEMAMLEEQSKRLASTYGGSATEQVKAFYQAISAGADGVKGATQLLDAANKLAIGGVTDVTTAVDGLTTATNVYVAEGLSAASASDALFVAMKAGKTTISELSSNLGAILPISQAAGVSFDETAAAVAALTKGGLSTSMAVTSLKSTIAQVIKPTQEASKAAKRLGLDFSAAGLESLGFGGFMDEVIAKTGGSKEELTQLFGSIESLPAVFGFAGAAGKSFADIMDDMAAKSGETEAAVEKVASSMDHRLSVALGKLTNMAILVGDALLKFGTPLVEAVAEIGEAFQDLTGWFSSLFEATDLVEQALDNSTLAMADQITQTRILGKLLDASNQMSADSARIQLQEASARLSAVTAMRAQNEALLKEELGWNKIKVAIMHTKAELLELETVKLRADESGISNLTTNRADRAAAAERVRVLLAEQLRLQGQIKAVLDSTSFLSTEQEAQMAAARANINELETLLGQTLTRWGDVNDETSESATLTNRAVVETNNLASGLGRAAGQAATLSAYLNGLPGALVGAAANIAGLRASVLTLSSGGSEASASLAKYRAELETTYGVAKIAHYETRQVAQNAIDAQVEQRRQVQLLTADEQARIALLNAVNGKDGGGSMNDVMREASSLYQSTRTAAEKYSEELTKINALHDAGMISAETYTRAIDQIDDKYKLVGDTIEESLTGGIDSFSSAMSGVIVQGNDLRSSMSNVFKGIANDILDSGIRSALKHVFSTDKTGSSGLFGSVISGIGSLFGFADGGAFNQGRVIPFASGGVVSGPSYFDMANGNTGLMGEAGPEAIMPLSRGPDGKLGVQASGGGGGNVFHFSPVIQVEGNGDDVERIEQALAKANAEFETRVIQSVNTAKKRRQLS